MFSIAKSISLESFFKVEKPTVLGINMFSAHSDFEIHYDHTLELGSDTNYRLHPSPSGAVEADQLAIYKRRREVSLGASENNINSRSERDLNLRPTDF